MAKFKPYNYDQLVMLPISLEDQLEPGTLEYTINVLVENHIDLSVFEGRYQNDETGARAFKEEVEGLSDLVDVNEKKQKHGRLRKWPSKIWNQLGIIVYLFAIAFILTLGWAFIAA